MNALLAVVLALATPRPAAAIPAFPGAEGFGAQAVGGRGGRVMEVTTLADRGEGSLRACIEGVGPRNCIFRVSGTIELDTELVAIHPYLTIAGQSAPGEGVSLKNYGLTIRTSHVIVRYLRVRPGAVALPNNSNGITVQYAEPGIPQPEGLDNHDIIVDHCSVSWGTDDLISAWGYGQGGPDRVTFQWNIVSEGLNCGAWGRSTFVSGCGSRAFLIGNGARRVSAHHNLFAHNYQRHPELKGGTLDFVNNVVYDSYGIGVQLNPMDSAVHANVVGNRFKDGPSLRPETKGYGDIVLFGGRPFTAASEFFVHGNVGAMRPVDSLWEEADVWHDGGAPLPVGSRLDMPLVTTTDAAAAEAAVLADAGASRPARDAVDRRVVDEARRGGGHHIDYPEDVGGWPELATGVAAPDSDHDGIPDEWELRFGLDPHDPADGPALGPDGYSHLEEYLNGIEPPSPQPQAGPREVWVSPTPTGRAELGTKDAPYVADTAEAFDRLMLDFSWPGTERFLGNGSVKATIHLMAGTFWTHVDYANGGRSQWRLQSNWTLRGEERDRTILKIDPVSPVILAGKVDVSTIEVRAITGWGAGRDQAKPVQGVPENQLVTDLTIDGSFSELRRNYPKIALRVSGIALSGHHSAVERVRLKDLGSTYTEAFGATVDGAWPNTTPPGTVFNEGCEQDVNASSAANPRLCTHISDSLYEGKLDPAAYNAQLTVFVIGGAYNNCPGVCPPEGASFAPDLEGRVDFYQDGAYLVRNKVLIDASEQLAHGARGPAGEGNQVQGLTIYHSKSRGLVQDNEVNSASIGYYSDWWRQQDVTIDRNTFVNVAVGVDLKTDKLPNFHVENFRITNNLIRTIPAYDGSRAAIRIQRIIAGETFKYYPALDGTPSPTPRYLKDILIEGNSLLLASPPPEKILNMGISAHEVDGLTIRGNTLDSRFWRQWALDALPRLDSSYAVLATYENTRVQLEGNMDERGVALSTAAPRGRWLEAPKSFDGKEAVEVPEFRWPQGGPVTVSFWNRVTASEVGEGAAFSVGNLDGNRFSSHAPWRDGRLYWDYGNAYGPDRVTADYWPYLDKWTHVTLTGGGAHMAIYLDGELKASSTTSLGPQIALQGLSLGRFGSYRHKGRIKDFRIYDRELSPAEIKALYEAGVPFNGAPTRPDGSKEVWVSPTPTGRVELGTKDAPYVADTAEAFDRLMQDFSRPDTDRFLGIGSVKATIHLLAGTFRTHVDYHNRGRSQWTLQSNWTLRGEERDRTTLKIDPVSPVILAGKVDVSTIEVRAITGFGVGRDGKQVPENQVVSDLTIDGSFSELHREYPKLALRVSGIDLSGQHSAIERVHLKDLGSTYAEAFGAVVAGAWGDIPPDTVFNQGCEQKLADTSLSNPSLCSHISDSRYDGKLDPAASRNRLSVFVIGGALTGHDDDEGRVDHYQDGAYLVRNQVLIDDGNQPAGRPGGEGNLVHGLSLYHSAGRGLVEDNVVVNASIGYYSDRWRQQGITIHHNAFTNVAVGVDLKTDPLPNFHQEGYRIADNIIRTVPSYDGGRAGIRIQRSVAGETFKYYPALDGTPSPTPRYVKDIVIDGNAIVLEGPPSGPILNMGISAHEVDGLSITSNTLDSRFWRALELDPAPRMGSNYAVLATYENRIERLEGNVDDLGKPVSLETSLRGRWLETPKALGGKDSVEVPEFRWPQGGPVTVSFWNRVTASEVGEGAAFSVGNLDGNRFSSHAPWRDGRLYWDYGNAYGPDRVTADYRPYLDKWTLVTLTGGGAHMAIYLDGELKASSTTSLGPQVALEGLSLGRFANFRHQGLLADFRIYDRELSPAEIKTLYEAGGPSAGTPDGPGGPKEVWVSQTPTHPPASDAVGLVAARDWSLASNPNAVPPDIAHMRWFSEDVPTLMVNPGGRAGEQESTKVLDLSYAGLAVGEQVSIVHVFSSTGVDLSGKKALEVTLLGDYSNNELNFTLGGINEDADGDGVLDTEDADGDGILQPQEDIGFLYNPTGKSSARIGAGNGRIDSEDLNQNGRLDPADNSGDDFGYNGSALAPRHREFLDVTSGTVARSMVDFDAVPNRWHTFRIPLDVSRTTARRWNAVKQLRISVRRRSPDGAANGQIKFARIAFVGSGDEAAPVITPIPDATVVRGQPLVLTLSAVDANGSLAPMAYSASSLPPGASFDPVGRKFSWTPTRIPSKPWSVRFTATNFSGLSSSIDVAITVVDAPLPRLARILVPADGAEVGGEIEVVGSAEGPVTRTLLLLDGLTVPLAESSLSSASIRWDSAFVSSGTHRLGVRAFDAFGRQVEGWTTVTVKDVTAPTIRTVRSESCVVCVSTSVFLDVTDQIGVASFEVYVDSGPKPVFAAVSPPFSFTFDARLLPPGLHTLSARAFDAAGNLGRELLVFEVPPPAPPANRPPVLSPTDMDLVMATEGSSVAAKAVAVDPDGDAVTYRLEPLPRGADFNPSSGLFTWTPDSTQAGTYPFRLTAFDGRGLSSSRAGKVVVLEENGLPWRQPYDPDLRQLSLIPSARHGLFRESDAIMIYVNRPARDESGNGNDAILDGFGQDARPAGPPGLGNALYFGGASQLIIDGNKLRPAGDMSVALWFKAEPTAAPQPLLSLCISSGSSGLRAYVDRRELLVEGEAGGAWHSSRFAFPDYALDAGTYWHHAAIVFRGGSLGVYLDGELLADKLGRRESPWGGNPTLVLGFPSALGAADPDYFRGWLDEAAVFERALDASEVAGLARGGKATSVAGAAAAWGFEESYAPAPIRVFDADGRDVFSGVAGGVPRLPPGHYFVETPGDRAEFAVLPDDYHGADFIGTEADTGLFPTVTEKIDQIQPGWQRDMGRAYWSQVAPAPGVWDWTSADQMKGATNKGGRKTYIEAFVRPDWIRTVPESRWNELFADYVRQTVAHFKATVEAHGRLDGVELWNEPLPSYWTWLGLDQLQRAKVMLPDRRNSSSWTKDWMDYYVELFKAGYDAAKKADPDVKIYGPAMDKFFTQEEMFRRLKSAGLLDKLNAVTWHDYSAWYYPQDQDVLVHTGEGTMVPSFYHTLLAAREIIGNKPIHINEYGLWGRSELGNPPSTYEETSQRGSFPGLGWRRGMLRAVKGLVIARAEGAEAVVAHQLTQVGMERSGWESLERGPKPKTTAFLMTAYRLAGAKLVAKRTPGEKAFVYEWRGADGRTSVFAWALEGTRVPLSGALAAIDVYGRARLATALEEAPVIFPGATAEQVLSRLPEGLRTGPVLKALADVQVLVGNALVLTASAYDPNSDPASLPISYSVAPLPPGAVFNSASGVLSWTPMRALSAPWGITVTATDARGLRTSSAFSIKTLRASTAGLIGEWRFDEGAGGSAKDGSASANDGVLTGFDMGKAWVEGAQGKALHFDGVDDFVRLDSAKLDGLANDFTVSAWVRAEDFDNRPIVSLRSREGSSGLRLFMTRDKQGTMNVLAQGFAGGRWRSVGFGGGQEVFWPGRWQHVALVCEHSKLRVFLDGEDLGNVFDWEGDFVMDPAQPSAIGRAPSAPENPWYYQFKGDLDEVLVFRRPLTPPEVRALFAGTLRSEPLSARIVAPAPGAAVAGVVNVAASAEGTALVRVELFVDASTRPLAALQTLPISFRWDTTSLSTGSHRLGVKAFDAAGRFAEDWVTVSVKGREIACDTARPGLVVAVDGAVSAEHPTSGARLDFPEGALASPLEVTLQPLSSAETPGAGKLLRVGAAHDFGPHGTAFARAVTLTLPYEGDVPPRIYYFNPVKAAWEAVLGSEADARAHTVRAPISHFSLYAAFADPAEAPATGERTHEAFTFPNPARGAQRPTVRVVLSQPVDRVLVTIRTLSGEGVRELELVEPEPRDGMFVYDGRLDTAGLPSGVYWVVTRAQRAGRPESGAITRAALVK